MRCGKQLTRNREGTLKPLSWSVFEALKTVRILRRFRGQRGGQLKSSSRFSTWFFSSKFKVSANIVDVHKTPSVSSNIQVQTYDVIMETIPNAVSPYPSTSSSGRSTFESRTINVAFTPRSQPFSSSAQRNCTTSKLKIVHLNIRSLRSPSRLTELRDWAATNKTEPSRKLGWIPPLPTLRLALTAKSSTDRIGYVNAAGESVLIVAKTLLWLDWRIFPIYLRIISISFG